MVTPNAPFYYSPKLILYLTPSSCYGQYSCGNCFFDHISVLESGMAPIIAGSIIAISRGLNRKLASLMVGIGIPLSFLTLTVWYFLLE